MVCKTKRPEGFLDIVKKNPSGLMESPPHPVPMWLWYGAQAENLWLPKMSFAGLTYNRLAVAYPLRLTNTSLYNIPFKKVNGWIQQVATGFNRWVKNKGEKPSYVLKGVKDEDHNTCIYSISKIFIDFFLRY